MWWRFWMAVVCVLSLVRPSLADEAESPPVSLGITVQAKDLADARLMPQGAPTLKSRSCVVVTEVDPGGPSVGKLSVNNAIISIDGVPTPDVAAFEKALKGLKPDTEIAIKGLYLAPAPLGEQKWVPGSVVVRVAGSRSSQRDAAGPSREVVEDQPPKLSTRPIAKDAEGAASEDTFVDSKGGDAETKPRTAAERPADLPRQDCLTIRVGNAGDDLILSPAANVLATLTWNSSPKVTLWDTQTGKRLGTTPEDGSPLGALTFSPDGQSMLSIARHDDKIRVWDTRTAKERPSIAAAGGQPERLVFSPDGKRLAFDGGSLVTVYDLRANKPLLTLRGHDKQSDVRDIAFTPDGKLIATASTDLTVRVCSAESGKELHVLRGRRAADAVAFSRDGRILAYLSGFTVVFWDVAKAEEILSTSVRESGPLQFTADGQWLVVGTRRPQVIDTTTGKEREAGAIGQEAMCSQVALARDSDVTAAALVGSVGEGGWQVKFLANLTEDLYSTPVAGSGLRPCPSLSHDGGICAFFSAPGEVQVIDVRAAAVLDKKEKETARALATKEEREKVAREKTRAEQRARTEALAAADSKAKQDNSLPRWPDHENLDLILAGFQQGPAADFEQFVRFGTADNARKALEGDRFDREDAESAAKDHRAKLGKRRFFIQRNYEWLEDRISKPRPDSVCLQVPLGFRCLMPANDSAVQVSACDQNDVWYMTKDGSLKQCPNWAFAQEAERNKGILYLPEVLDRCNLQIWFDGDREVKKRVAREPASFVVNIGISQLQLARPFTMGFFRVDQLRVRSFDTLSLLGSFNVGGPTAGPIEQPFYFVTKAIKGIDDKTIPEVATAHLERLEIVESTGEKRKVVFEREFRDD